MDARSVAVVGLGLIGGSLARDLASRGVHVLGFDENPESLRLAAEEGIIHASLPATFEGIERAEVVVLAIPVAAAPRLLSSLAPRLGNARLITDVGSTKASIIAAAERSGVADRFVGSHPLCGDHRSGWTASRTELFRDARVFLCPAITATPEAVDVARRLWADLDARPLTLSTDEHDRMMAWVSHLPQLTATALALALDNAGIKPESLGPGGREMTRLAGSSPEMWSAICRDNAEQIRMAISALEAQLSILRAELGNGKGDDLDRLLQISRDWSLSHTPCNEVGATQRESGTDLNREDP